jgi:predicted nucleotidyltransferase
VTHPVVDKVLAVLRRSPHVERVILFGSRARLDHEARSDFDIAVDCPRADRREWSRLWNAVDEIETLHAIDLLRLDQAGPELRRRIEREGVVLFAREGAA